MITPTVIRRRAEAHYLEWLNAVAGGRPAYQPLRIDRTGDQKNAENRWESLRDLVDQSKDKIGYGYRIELEAPAPNSKNKQSRFRAVVFDTAADLLQFLGKEAEFKQFQRDFGLISAIPELAPWCATHVRDVVRYASDWPRLLAVARFFQGNPHPDVPARLLPVAGVDTKFIEQNNAILCQLLDRILPAGAINAEHKNFSKRYGLPEQAPLIECAWNDPGLISHYGGFSRLAFPVDQLDGTPLEAARILVVENRNSVRQILQAPLPGCIVIFGGGFGVALLKNCGWLRQKDLYYWGDLDAHGLAILSRFRDFFPHTQALMMNKATFDAFQHACVTGKPYQAPAPANLTEEERLLFQYLNDNLLRLEQERVEVRRTALPFPD